MDKLLPLARTILTSAPRCWESTERARDWLLGLDDAALLRELPGSAWVFEDMVERLSVGERDAEIPGGAEALDRLRWAVSCLRTSDVVSAAEAAEGMV